MKKIIIFISLWFVLSSCGTKEVQLEKYYSTRNGEQSKIDITESYVGYVKSDITTTLSSEVGWEILSIPVKEWQKIKVGETIANINVDTSTLAYQWWESIIESFDTMKQSISESFDTQIAVTNSQLQQAQIELDANKVALSDTTSLHLKETDALKGTLKVAEESLALAQAEKSETERTFTTKEATIYSNAKNALTALMIIDTNINTYIDEVFELSKENDYKNDDYYQFLGAKNTWFKESTRNKAFEIKSAFEDFKNLYDSNIGWIENPSKENIDKALSQSVRFNDSLKIFLSDMYTVYDTSIESAPYFTAEIIQWQKSKISTFWQQIEQALISTSWDMLLGVKGTLQSINALHDEKSKALTILDKKISLSQANFESVTKNTGITPINQETQIHQNTTNGNLIKEKITQIQASLKNLEASRKARLDEIDSQITKASVETSLQRLSSEKWMITSPLSGVITKKYVDIGSVLWPGQQLVEISDDSSKKITTEIPQETLARIKVWDEVSIFLDGKDSLIKGTISMIFPFQDEKTRKTRIEIRFPEISKVILWSRVKVYLTRQTSLWVTIPKKAIVQTYSLPWVYIINNWKAEFQHITIIDQNEDFAIVEGLSEKSEIIVLWKENIFDGEDVSNYKKLPE